MTYSEEIEQDEREHPERYQAEPTKEEQRTIEEIIIGKRKISWFPIGNVMIGYPGKRKDYVCVLFSKSPLELYIARACGPCLYRESSTRVESLYERICASIARQPRPSVSHTT